MDSAYFSGRTGGEKNLFPENFFSKFGSIYCPVAGKPLCFEVGTSVASALTAETIFGIMKCVMSICVAACAWGQNLKFSCFSILAMPTIEIFRFFDVGH